MKGNNEIVKALNTVLTNELTAINQYFLHARMFGHWGFDELNEAEYKQSIRVMKEADSLIERVLFLEGLPNLQQLGTLGIGENVEECLESDLAFEQRVQRVAINQGISLCEEQQDYVSRALLQQLLDGCETSIDWYETQLSLIENVGLANYLQRQISSD